MYPRRSGGARPRPPTRKCPGGARPPTGGPVRFNSGKNVLHQMSAAAAENQIGKCKRSRPASIYAVSCSTEAGAAGLRNKMRVRNQGVLCTV